LLCDAVIGSDDVGVVEAQHELHLVCHSIHAVTVMVDYLHSMGSSSSSRIYTSMEACMTVSSAHIRTLCYLHPKDNGSKQGRCAPSAALATMLVQTHRQSHPHLDSNIQPRPPAPVHARKRARTQQHTCRTHDSHSQRAVSCQGRLLRDGATSSRCVGAVAVPASVGHCRMLQISYV
jgi:hypothetical protein